MLIKFKQKSIDLFRYNFSLTVTAPARGGAAASSAPPLPASLPEDQQLLKTNVVQHYVQSLLDMIEEEEELKNRVETRLET